MISPEQYNKYHDEEFREARYEKHIKEAINNTFEIRRNIREIENFDDSQLEQGIENALNAKNGFKELMDSENPEEIQIKLYECHALILKTLEDIKLEQRRREVYRKHDF